MNVGEYLVSKSPLNSGTALAHLLAMQTGSVVGKTIFASMFALRMDTPRLALMHRRAKNVCGDEPALQRIEERRNDVFVTTAEAQATACLRSETLTLTSGRARSVFVMREVENAVVRKSDVVEMTEG